MFNLGFFDRLPFNIPLTVPEVYETESAVTLYQRYINTLKTDYTSATKIEFLYPDGSVAYSITEDVIQDGSTLNVSYQKSGTRRTATLVVDNWNQIYKLHPDKIWFGQQIKISKGLYFRDGTEFLLPQGIFYVTNPNEVFNPSERTNTLSLVDKWSQLDGSLFGNFAGTYILNVDDNLYTAIDQLLQTDRGNGYVLDNIPPMYDNEYLTKTYTVDSVTYNYLDCPYTAKVKGAYADVLNEINTMLVSEMWYDPIGRLRVVPANIDIDDNRRAVLWQFSTLEKELLGISLAGDLQNTYNHVVITGGTLNGHIARGEASNDDPASPTSIGRIGQKTAPMEEQSKYYSDEQCQELAEYRLKEYKKVATTATIQCSPMYHLQENCLVTIYRDGVDDWPIPYLITGWSLPLGQTGEMTITASKLTVPSDNLYLEPTVVSEYLGTIYSGETWRI